VSSSTSYLLDVSTLVAFGVRSHIFHQRVSAWIGSGQFASLATCPITELGFIRVVAQTTQYGLNVEQARILLLRMKQIPRLALTFISDDQDVVGLPGWVRTGGQTTDGHLLQLATAHGAVLATLDGGIPGAFVVP